MRSISIAPGEHYHIFNRGNNQQQIFIDANDWARFMFLILHFQSPELFYNIGRYTTQYVKHRVFNIDSEIIDDISKHRFVELVNFALMPNHFHLTVKEAAEGGIAQYMQRVLNSYTKYFNTKYNKSGHLFQGPYKNIHIENDRQLLYLSTYIHRNPRELKSWKQKEHEYPWSSYQDYIGSNRWGSLLVPNIVLDQFEDNKEYYRFTKTSTAKLLDTECSTLMLDN